MNVPGLNIVVSPFAPPPRDPTPGEWAARYVRTQLVDRVGEHLAGKRGPEPDAPVYTTYVIGSHVICHRSVARLIGGFE